jgi:glycosyltransferase involved in cell wall biosynthesis
MIEADKLMSESVLVDETPVLSDSETPMQPELATNSGERVNPVQKCVDSVARGVEISVVTTALNEVGNVNAFLAESVEALQQLNVAWEILYIDDGSRDGTGDRVLEFAAAHNLPSIRLIRHGHSKGITAAIDESIRESRGKFVCLLPADMECSPKADIPVLYNAMDDQIDVVVGRRIGRADGKSFASAVYNYLNRRLFGIHLHDANWIKMYRRDKARGIHLRSEWHRFFIPILVSRGCRLKEVGVQWHSRKFGKSNFGLSRFPVSLADMLAVKLILSYGAHPLLCFGWITVFCGLFGIATMMLTSGLGGYILGVSGLVLAGFSLCIGICAELLMGMKGQTHQD